MTPVWLTVAGEVIMGAASEVRPVESPVPPGWVLAQKFVGVCDDGSPEMEDVLVSRDDSERLVAGNRNTDPTQDIDGALREHMARLTVEVSIQVYERRVRDIVAVFGETLEVACVAAGWFGIELETEALRKLAVADGGLVRTADVAYAGGFIYFGVEPRHGVAPILLLLAIDDDDDLVAAWAEEVTNQVEKATRPYREHLEVLLSGLELVRLVAGFPMLGHGTCPSR
jgi:hypothetical protein